MGCLLCLIGEKISIVTSKPNTTRHAILGVLTRDDCQIIFIDTPGIFQPRRRLDRAMVAAAWIGTADADEVLLLVDASRGLDRNTAAIVKKLKRAERTVILAINKVDLVNKPDLLALAAELNEAGAFTDTFMISAETGDGVADLMALLAGRVAAGRWLFPEDQISDMPGRLTAAEITREQLYLQLHKELPYAAAVETESWKDQDDGSLRIEQVVYVERGSQKAIVLGKKGSRVKSIGEAARKELEEIFGRRVHLFLFVKVRGNWGDDPERYRDLGLDFDA